MSTGSQATERVVARLRPHARALFWPSVVLVGAVGGMAYFGGQFRERWQDILVLGVGAALILFLWLLPLLSWLGRRYIITTRRVILRSGLFVRTRQELLHSRGYDVTVRQNGLQALFGSGDVFINTGQERPVLLRDVPRAELVQGALHDLIEKNAV